MIAVARGPPPPPPQYGDDLESGGGLLYPGIDATDNSLRWGFVRKVGGGGLCHVGLQPPPAEPGGAQASWGGSLAR